MKGLWMGSSFCVGRGVDYTLVHDPENKDYPYLFVETKFYLKQRAKIQEPVQK